MAKGTRTKQPEQKTEAPPRGGLEAAQQQMSAGGSRFPILKLEDGDRARFHFLSSGSDLNLVGTIFHRFGQDVNTRFYMCLRVFTGGEEACVYCEAGHDDTSSRFAVWVFVHNMLHASQKETKWKATEVDDADGEKRTLFREEIKKPFLIRMAAGWKQKWFAMVMNGYTTHGSLQTHIYELERTGKGLETEYVYRTIGGERPIAKEILDSDEVKDLETAEVVLREELKFGPSASGAGSSGMGTDEVLGASSDGTKADPEPETQSETQPESPGDDLI